MTKLTKEQIEQERVKFEKTYSMYLKNNKAEEFINIWLKPLWNGNRYVYPRQEVDFIFQFWLARAELDKGE